MGIIVGEISEVLYVCTYQLEPAHSFGTTISTDFLVGKAKVGEKVIMLFGVDKDLGDMKLEIK